MKVMFYTFHNTTEWWRHIASQLEFASDTVLVSDLPEADIDIGPRFEQHMEQRGAAERAAAEFGADACGEVIARCRLLRALDTRLATRMIGAMWLTIIELIDRERPDVFVCFLVDRYVLDLFERALAKRGVPYIGLAVGILPDTFMFMSRGQFWPIRVPSDAEVRGAVAVLSERNFVPTYVSAKRFDLGEFVRLYCKFTARWMLFELLRRVTGRPHDFRYLSAGPAECGQRVRIRDWRVMSFIDQDWRAILDATPVERRVFVALPVTPEAAIDYWVRDISMIDTEAVLLRLADKLGAAGFRLFVKDHPSQFGFRRVELIEKLAGKAPVTVVPYAVAGQWLIENCRATFTWTGTVGFQAAFWNRCPIVSADAYYVTGNLFLTNDDLSTLPDRLSTFSPPRDLAGARTELTRHILASTAPGDYLSWDGFDSSDPLKTSRMRTMIESLNRYLPVAVRYRAAEIQS